MSTAAEILDRQITEEPSAPVPARPVDRDRPSRQARRRRLSAQDTEERQLEDLGRRWRLGLAWPVVIWMGILHLGALLAPFYFSWQGLAVTLGLGFVSGCLGITMCYHRLLTHKSFETYRPLRWLFALMGTLAGEGSALTWVATHRKHHRHSDHAGDPHSPRLGFWWSHMVWFMPNFGRRYEQHLWKRYAPDLAADPVMRFLDRTFILWHIALGAVLFTIGYALSGTYMGMSLLVYGLFLRLVYVLHATWFVNSATHLWGYRNYETTDHSRNLWWVALLTYGEGWHNNHHAFQRMARHGHRWWEIDVTYGVILLLEKLGLAWNVVHEVPGSQTSRQGQSG